MNIFHQSIRLEYPSEIPTSVGILPGVWMKFGKDFQKLIDEYPQFFHGQQVDLSQVENNLDNRYREGKWVDSWGCVWENVHAGNDAIVTEHPVADEDGVFSLQIPADRSGNDLPHGFMYLRLLDLCGFENAMIMFAEEDKAIETLIDKVLEYNIYQVAALIPRINDFVSFGDDLGMQKGLAIGAERWRKYLKPCFRKLYGMIKAARPDTLIYMHTDGCIHEIMPDLVECGVDIINPQYRANGIENLVQVCRRDQIIPIDLDMDRQLFPFATRSQIFDHFAEAVESLYLPQGGLCLKVEFNHDLTLDQMANILDAMEKYRFYKG